ncbi:MAG: T9SS type A sorting domain-containing protein [Lewinellaceae bacterium]|nr:T9SS type A sorting domain-containing protein [Lewinellaceae bacterium]
MALAQTFDPCEEYGSDTPDITIGSDQCDIEFSSELFPMQILITDEKVAINGTFVIDKTLNFEDCIIEMGPDAEIFIESGFGLHLEGCTIYSCTNLWRAIRVGPGGNLGLSESDNQRNHIQDAKAADFAHDGSTVALTGTNFVNNVIGFYIPPNVVQPLPITTYNIVNLTRFWDLNFECTASLLTPSTMYCDPHLEIPQTFNVISPYPEITCFAGVVINDVRILQLSSTYEGADNLYRNLQNGIVAHNSDVFVQYSTFEDMPVNSYSYGDIIGYGIYTKGYGEILDQQGYGFNEDPSFTDVRFPIRAYKLSKVISRDNNIVNANEAYKIEHCKEGFIDLHYNQIEAKRIGISLYQNDPTYEMNVGSNEITMTGSTSIFSNNGAWGGIWIDEMSNKHATPAKIQYNIINGGNSVWGGINALNSYNLDIEGNQVNLDSDVSVNGIGLMGGLRNVVRDNEITGSGTSDFNFFMAANFGVQTQNSPLNYILCNEYENVRVGHGVVNFCTSSVIGRNLFTGPFHTGLWYDHTGISGHQLNTLNTWPGNAAITGGHEARHQGGLQQIWSSVYEVHSNVTDGMPDPVDPNEDWFNPNNTYDPLEACEAFTQPFTLPDPGFIEERIAVDSIDVPEDAPAYLWNLQKYLYQYLHLWPSGTFDETIYDDFMDVHEAGQVGEWCGIEEDIRQTFRLDSLDIALRKECLDTLYIAMDELDFYRHMRDTATTSIDSLAATNNIAGILSDMNDYIEAYQGDQYLSDSLRKEAWEGLIVDIANAPDSSDWTEALQTVWTIYLESLIGDTVSFDSLTLLSLESIAENCALTHGEAVYLAGSLRSINTDKLFSYECPETESLVLSTDQLLMGEPGFSLQPNPAGNVVTVHFNDQDPQGGELVVMDLLGTIQLRQVVNGSVVNLYGHHLTSGMYIVIWLRSEQSPVSKALIINR